MFQKSERRLDLESVSLESIIEDMSDETHKMFLIEGIISKERQKEMGKKYRDKQKAEKEELKRYREMDKKEKEFKKDVEGYESK